MRGKKYKAFGEEKTIREWSKDSRCKICLRALQGRIKNNWPLEVALTSEKGFLLKWHNLIGKRFGKLIVIERVGAIGGQNDESMFWKCQCDCGNVKNIRTRSLLEIKSCGCSVIESNKKRFSKKPGEATKNMVLATYKIGAKSRKIKWKLSKSDFFKLTQQVCYYCGREPSNIKKSLSNNGDFIYNGIDRLNNNDFYVKENCVSCCSNCNVGKWEMSEQEFLDWIKRVYNFRIAKNT